MRDVSVDRAAGRQAAETYLARIDADRLDRHDARRADIGWILAVLALLSVLIALWTATP
jgi:hypothetical protein